MIAMRAQNPALPMAAIAALVLVTLVGVAGVRLAGVSTAQVDPSPVTRVRLLHFEDRADGGIDIVDAASNLKIDSVAPGTNGFLRSAMRGMARDRKRQGVGAETPFVLAAHADGRLTLDDPRTGRTIDLKSFGPSNAGVFIRLLPPSGSRAAS